MAQGSILGPFIFIVVMNGINISGVAKLLDSPSHFSKLEIFREPQLNTYLKGVQKKGIKKFSRNYIYWKHK